MYKSLLLFLLIILAYSAIGQDYRFKSIKAIKEKVRWMEVDKMQQLYLIKDDHTLEKYTPDGQLLFQFNENALGEISCIDISNPFRILVFYQDYGMVIFLDRTLSEINRHDLSELEISQVQAIATASDNNIWLFDNDSYTLKKISNQNEVLLESADLNLLLSEDLIPERMMEFDTRVYLNAPETGILVFDVFGNYIKTIDIRHLDYFQMYEGQVFYVRDKSFITYHLLSFQTKEIKLPVIEDKLVQVCIGQERLYLRYPDKTEIIAIQKK